MKKKFKIEELCCAGCAAKIEDSIKKLKGVNDVSINFITQKLIIDADDERFEEILIDVQKIAAKIEPDCRIIIK